MAASPPQALLPSPSRYPGQSSYLNGIMAVFQGAEAVAERRASSGITTLLRL